MNRFAIVDEDYQTVVRDMERGMNLFFVAEGGHGVTSSTRQLAQRCVDFLNSLPPDQMLFYQYVP